MATSGDKWRRNNYADSRLTRQRYLNRQRASHQGREIVKKYARSLASRYSRPGRISVERRRGKGESFSSCAEIDPKNGEERLLEAKRSTPLSTIGLRMRYFSSLLKETEREDLRLGLLDTAEDVDSGSASSEPRPVESTFASSRSGGRDAPATWLSVSDGSSSFSRGPNVAVLYGTCADSSARPSCLSCPTSRSAPM